MRDTDESPVPVYVSFQTFKSAISDLRSHGLPNVVDRSAWSSRSGSDQSQIMTALKFLGLIDKAGNTQEALRRLVAAVENSKEEKAAIQELLRSRYPTVFGLDLKAATPNQLDSAIGSYGATGTTRDRAVRFFVKAAEFSGITLSKRLTKQTRNRSGANGSVKRGAAKVQSKKLVPAETQVPTGSAMKTIALPTVGGTLTLSGTFNAFDLIGDERDLIYEIVDKMNSFERKNSEVATEDD